MSLKAKLFLFGIPACLFIGVFAVLLVLTHRPPTPEVVYTVAEADSDWVAAEPRKPKPSMDVFLEGYLPQIADASPEVQAVMKEFDPLFRTVDRDPEIENFLPADEWFQKLLDMGIVIDDYSDYSGWLSTRYMLLHAHKDAEDLLRSKRLLNLHADASWDEVVEAEIRYKEKLNRLVDQAQAADPLVSGGSLDSRGVFIPNRENTAYVQTEGTMTDITAGTGVPEWVPQELAHRQSGMPPEREIPKHIDIIFLNDNGQPVSDEVAHSRAIMYQLEPYLIKGAERVNASETESVDRGTSIDDHSDIVLETETDDTDIPNRPQPDTDFNFDEAVIPDENALDASLAPKLPTESKIEAEKRLEEAERMLDDPESEDDLRRLKQIDPDAANEKKRGQHAPPTDDEQK